MKVYELIRLLEQVDQDLPVYAPWYESGWDDVGMAVVEVFRASRPGAWQGPWSALDARYHDQQDREGATWVHKALLVFAEGQAVKPLREESDE